MNIFAVNAVFLRLRHGFCHIFKGLALNVCALCKVGTSCGKWREMSLLTIDTGAGLAQSRTLATARYEVLDSWRGVCALLVALFHFPMVGALGHNPFVRGSFLFVDFFFVLSGFVIAHSYTNRVASADGFGRFLLTRIGRLFPLHAFILTVFVGFELFRMMAPGLFNGTPAFSDGATLDTLPANLALLHGLGIHDHLSWNAPSWSISAELFAYLAFGALVWALGRQSLIIFAVIAAIGPLLLFKLSPDYMDTTYDFGLIRCLFGFSAGVLTHAALNGRTSAAPDSTFAWTLAELAVIAAVILFVATAAHGPGGLLAPYLFAIAVALFAHEGGLVSRVMRLKPFLMLGALSYSIYMTHIFVQARMLNVAKLMESKLGGVLLTQTAHGPAFSSAAAVGAAVVMALLVIAVSIVTYRLVETPGREVFKRLAERVFQRRA
jgi:peptidoglycan/LPS O-acetylase OafA/YrhL